MQQKLFFLLLIGQLCFPGTLFAEIKLPHLFASHMVLQRDQPIKIWGWAEKGEKIKLSFDQKTYQAQADKKGYWSIQLAAMPAGGPYEMIIEGKNKLVLENILLGDVWVCSGQSNMQWKINQTPFTEEDTSFIKKNQLRLITVQIDTDFQARKDIKGGEWQSLDTENILQFSAVAYHFGKKVQQEIGVPIGLISSNLGASALEAWMSNESLMAFEQFHPDVKPNVAAGKSFEALRQDFEKIRKDWEQNHYLKGPGITDKWYLPETDISDWGEMTAPGTWEEQGLPGHDGAVWFRKEFDLPEGFSDDSMWIALSQLDDYDIAWVNGHKIGESYGRHNHRNYFAQSSYLKPKGNVIVLRVFDTGGQGGFTTHGFWASAFVRGSWKYKQGLKIDAATFPKVHMPNATPFSSPGVLYNANIAPLTALPIKGIIWYQGESNASRAYEYRELFPALIRDWRKQWKQEDLAFCFVQLANYMAEKDKPEPSDWAELREAQSMALALANTGMACTIDIGESGDIHPKNKVDVGIRLGLAAMKAAYKKKAIGSGPQFANMKIAGSRAIISFNSVADGLKSKDKYAYVRGFQLAGEDQVFYWAKAEIKENKVIVWCDDVDKPLALRYAWSDNPGPLDLYNSAGLPAVPFRTDTWQGNTFGKKYDYTLSRF